MKYAPMAVYSFEYDDPAMAGILLKNMEAFKTYRRDSGAFNHGSIPGAAPALADEQNFNAINSSDAAKSKRTNAERRMRHNTAILIVCTASFVPCFFKVPSTGSAGT